MVSRPHYSTSRTELTHSQFPVFCISGELARHNEVERIFIEEFVAGPA